MGLSRRAISKTSCSHTEQASGSFLGRTEYHRSIKATQRARQTEVEKSRKPIAEDESSSATIMQALTYEHNQDRFLFISTDQKLIAKSTFFNV